MNSPAALVVATDLGRHFSHAGEKIVALDTVNLRVERGELVAVVGSSGAGKTTLLNLLSGLLEPTSGEVVFDGLRLGAMDESRLARLRLERMGLVFQESCLIAALSALDNVRLPLHLAGRLAGGRERARELLGAVGLEGRERHFPRQLSRGEMQRVAIARALACDPDLLLADEPTGNLDEASSLAVMELLRRASGEEGKAVVLATHDRTLTAAADRTVSLSYGQER